LHKTPRNLIFDCQSVNRLFNIFLLFMLKGLGPAYLAAALQPVVRILGRQRRQSSSTSGTGCPIYATVHCRRPSVSHRRSTNMEQFVSWS